MESEDQQLLLINLLNDFENCLDRIRDIFHQEQAMNEDDDDQWEVVDEDEDTQKKKQRIKCSAADLINEVESTRNMVQIYKHNEFISKEISEIFKLLPSKMCIN